MGFNSLDLVVIGCYLAGVTLFGLRFRSGQQTLKGYFLADNAIPWWAISLSIVAAETSTLTVISVPGLAYDKDFSFLQLVFGYLIGRVVVSFVLIPQYFRGELVYGVSADRTPLWATTAHADSRSFSGHAGCC